MPTVTESNRTNAIDKSSVSSVNQQFYCQYKVAIVFKNNVNYVNGLWATKEAELGTNWKM